MKYLMFKIPTFRLKLQPSSGESDKNLCSLSMTAIMKAEVLAETSYTKFLTKKRFISYQVPVYFKI